ncbi:MAG: hypothetical protein ALECFALPRED_008095 [Alectoria fallacina]|uniref:Ribonuclease H2 subunit B n=1 Tax=Alectoria fallacina TaxID=1903189 RepID=A0A8H3J2B5_9LECA|nr:MAG: hypothetical protein ALECFALPRED_008095 [Alectoria fallacina]
MKDEQADGPPKVLILPEDASPEARICTLAHPRTLNPCRYYFDPDKGLYELTRVAAPKSTCRSWLIGRRKSPVGQKDIALTGKALEKPKPELAEANDRSISDGYTVKNAEMLIATPIDPLFLLLSSFIHESSGKSPTSKRLFLSADDLLEKLSDKSKHFNYISSHEQMRLAMEQRLRAVCDTVDAGDEKMYRLSDEKLLHDLVRKAKTVIAKGLPASMEEQFVHKALETPVMVVKHEESSFSDVTMSQRDMQTSESIVSDAINSQASAASAEPTATAPSISTETMFSENVASTTNASELYRLLRLRTALSYIISSYVPLAIERPLNRLILSGKSNVDFKIVDERLADIAKMRAEAIASRSLGDFSRKRSMYEDDDAAEARAEKKRKKEEEEKRKKASESRGIKDLKKVDTKGMKKMSDFFGKAAVAKKK